MIPWTWRDFVMVVLWMVLGFIFAAAVGMALLAVTGYLANPDQLESNPPIWFFALFSSILYLVGIWAVYQRTVQRYTLSWEALGVNSFERQWLWRLPFLLVIQLMAVSAINLLVITPLMGGEFENPQIEMITGGGLLTPSDLLVLLVAIAIIAPIAEELLFRGMLYPLLRKRLSVWPAIVLNAALFSVVHFIPVLMPVLFVVGLMLAWVREQSNSIIPSIILHIMQNGLATVSIYFVVSQNL
ncbi:MAG: type II CAAX endopeptidase family protein [Chloroflexota bacterium]